MAVALVHEPISNLKEVAPFEALQEESKVGRVGNLECSQKEEHLGKVKELIDFSIPVPKKQE